MNLVSGVSNGIIIGGLAAVIVVIATAQAVGIVLRSQRTRRFKRMLQAQVKSDGKSRLGIEELLADLVRLNKETILGLQKRVEDLEARLTVLEPSSVRVPHARARAEPFPYQPEPLNTAPDTYSSPTPSQEPKPQPQPQPQPLPPKPRAEINETDRLSLATLEQAYRDAVNRMTLAAYEDFVANAQASPFDLINGALQRASESTAPLIGVNISATTTAILPSWVILESFPTIYRFERSMPEAVRLAFDFATSGSGRLALVTAAKASTTAGRLQITERGQLDGLSL